MRREQQESVEARREAIQAELEAHKSAAERNRLGQFATPPSLAVEIAEYVKSIGGGPSTYRFGEPSIGTGSFYSAALEVFGRELLEKTFSSATRSFPRSSWYCGSPFLLRSTGSNSPLAGRF